MKSIDKYVIDQLNSLVKEFNDIQVSYRYDSLCETYYVKILPSDIFKNSDELTCRRADILDEFLEHYPEESIVFLTEGSTITMEQPEGTISGALFGNSIVVDAKAEDRIEELTANYINFELLIPDMLKLGAGENNYALAA